MAARNTDSDELSDVVNHYLLDRDIEIKEIISDGNYTSVYKAIQNGNTLAVKVIDLKNESIDVMDEQFIRNECEIVLKVNHKFIIKTHSVLRIEDDFIAIISDFADGGDLITIIDREIPLEEHQIQRWFSQIVEAVEYLHSNGIAHRDIKPDNIVLQRGTAKLTDFGYSKISVDSDGDVIKTRDSCGTFQYLSPEQIVCLLYNQPYDPFTSDCYSLGVLLFLLVELDFPYHKCRNGWKREPLLKSIHTKQVNQLWKLKGKYCENQKIYSLLKQLLNPNFESRVTCYQILSHPWFRNSGQNLNGISNSSQSLNN